MNCAKCGQPMTADHLGEYPIWVCHCGRAFNRDITEPVIGAKHSRKQASQAQGRDPETEAQFQQAVLDLAHHCGWLVEHKRPARLVDGSWRTAIQGDKGGPDLLLARAGVVILAELKTDKGKLSLEQEAWHEAAKTVIWRPNRWTEIEATLKGEA